MTLGRRIATYRKLKGYTQEQLAEILCVSRQTVTKWEADAGLPDIMNCSKMSKVFGLTMEQLIEGGDPTIESVGLAKPTATTPLVTNSQSKTTEESKVELDPNKKDDVKENTLNEEGVLLRFFSKKNVFSVSILLASLITLIGAVMFLFAPLYQLKSDSASLSFSIFSMTIAGIKYRDIGFFCLVLVALILMLCDEMLLISFTNKSVKILKAKEDFNKIYKQKWKLFLSFFMTIVSLVLLILLIVSFPPVDGASTSPFGIISVILVMLGLFSASLLYFLIFSWIKKGKVNLIFKNLKEKKI